MHQQKSFPLRIADQDRRRGQRLARQMGLSENRLYSDLLQEGLLVREQKTYFEKLRALRRSAAKGLEILERAPDVPPAPEDSMPKPRRGSGSRRC